MMPSAQEAKQNANTSENLSDKMLLPRFTPKYLERIRKDWTRQEIASALDMRVREIEKIGDMTFLECGLCIIECEKHEFWRELGYAGFTAWMNSGKVKGSRSKRYAARAAMLSMIEINVTAEDGYQLPRGNAQVLAKVSKQNRPQLLEAAKTMEKREFLRHIEKNFPNEHLIDDSPMRFNPDKSQRQAIDAGIDAAMILEELTSREDVLEFWAKTYLEENQAVLEEKVQAANA
jgi:hypothetical protein